jgi:predicted regulator of Ras-like GTPase activity (Roadblock/LC7/MglB family)
MENILKSINSVSGITGSFICNSEGRVLASAMPALFNEAILSSLGRTITQTMTGLAIARRRKVGDIDLVYDQGRFIIMDLGEGSLCILCVRNINVPLLSLTANLAAKKLATMVKARKEKDMQEAAVREVWDSQSSMLMDEVHSIITVAQQKGTVLRATGDAAIRLHCPSASRLKPTLDDKVLDLVGRRKQATQINNIFKSLGYQPEVRFNSLHGDQRLRYVHSEKKLGIEVYLDALNMYHNLNVGDRLNLDEKTIPLADLLLWKLQNVEPNDEILKSIFIIVCDHELGGMGEPDKIDTTRILNLCANDWGWYKTVTINLDKSLNWATSFSDVNSSVFIERVHRLMQLIEETPKTTGWQLRARIGESVRWYETPE